jgi:Flp pilus assembly protein TadG
MKSQRSWLHHAVASRQRGAVAVEFALVIVPLLLIVGGVIEFGRVFWYYDALTKATRDGARYLSMVGPPLDTVSAETLVKDEANAAGLSSFAPGNVDITCTPDCTLPVHVTVTASYTVRLGEWLPLSYSGGGSGVDLVLQPHTTMRYMMN